MTGQNGIVYFVSAYHFLDVLNGLHSITLKYTSNEQSLPLRLHSPADLKSLAMTELQEKRKRKRDMQSLSAILIKHIMFFSLPVLVTGE